MENNIVEINHLDFGIEKFVITEEAYNLYKSDSGIWEFTLSFKTSKSIDRAKELEVLVDAEPYFEATAILSNNELKLNRGNIITQKQGYDYNRDENLSIFYYFDYNSIEELEIELLEVTKDFIIANVKGKTVINGSDGNNPDSELSISKTKFMLDKKLKRSFS
ncbi:hypothetical protein [Flavivirga rizhaonensis]|uniref:Uncharacterized protein n=1 Tax=Flavivirga rizhaonensis TaxID=2559571 RepID=A0A4S1DS22_9FLAO|nr:hypothetical protein [Flavivirga rizhaonensis]TGV00533.1 hypothetical protein EM932_19220 [Flavivirga rizhaonensis]